MSNKNLKHKKITVKRIVEGSVLTLLILSIVLAFIPLTPANATSLALDDSSKSDNNSASTFTIALTPTTDNSLIILDITTYGASTTTIISITNDKGLTLANRGNFSTMNTKLFKYYTTWSSHGTVTWNITFSSSCTCGAIVFDVLGADIVSPFDGYWVTDSGWGYTLSATKTTSVANTMLIATGMFDRGGLTEVSPCILIQKLSSYADLADEYNITSAIGTYTCQYTDDSSNGWRMVLEAIRQSGSPASATPLAFDSYSSIDTVNTISYVLPLVVNANNALIIVDVGCYNKIVTSVTDDKGNTYTLKDSTTSGSICLYRYYTVCSSRGILNINVTTAYGSYFGIIAYDILNADLTSSFDGSTSITSGTSSDPVYATKTTANANDLLIASALGWGNGIDSVSPFTKISYLHAYDEMTSEYRIVSSTGTYQANFTASSTAWIEMLDAIKEASSGNVRYSTNDNSNVPVSVKALYANGTWDFTTRNSPTWVSSGLSLSTNQYVDTPSMTTPASTDETITLWVDILGSLDAWKTYLRMGNVFFGSGGSGNLYADAYGGGIDKGVYFSTINTGVHCLTFVVNSTYIVAYTDNTIETQSALGAVDSANIAESLGVSSGANNFIVMSMSVWFNSSKTASQIASIVSAGSSSYQGSDLYWKFDEGSGVKVYGYDNVATFTTHLTPQSLTISQTISAVNSSLIWYSPIFPYSTGSEIWAFMSGAKSSWRVNGTSIQTLHLIHGLVTGHRKHIFTWVGYNITNYDLTSFYSQLNITDVVDLRANSTLSDYAYFTSLGITFWTFDSPNITMSVTDYSVSQMSAKLATLVSASPSGNVYLDDCQFLYYGNSTHFVNFLEAVRQTQTRNALGESNIIVEGVWNGMSFPYSAYNFTNIDFDIYCEPTVNYASMPTSGAYSLGGYVWAYNTHWASITQTMVNNLYLGMRVKNFDRVTLWTGFCHDSGFDDGVELYLNPAEWNMMASADSAFLANSGIPVRYSTNDNSNVPTNVEVMYATGTSDATLQGSGITWLPNNGLHFTGSGNYTTQTKSLDLSQLQAFTIITAVKIGDISAYDGIWTNWGTYVGQEQWLLGKYSVPSEISFGLKAVNGTTAEVDSSPLLQGKNYIAVITWDGTTLTLYINGTSVSHKNINSIITDNGVTEFGRYAYVDSLCWHGDIYYGYALSRVLSNSEITGITTLTNPSLNFTGLIYGARMDEGSGTKLYGYDAISTFTTHSVPQNLIISQTSGAVNSSLVWFNPIFPYTNGFNVWKLSVGVVTSWRINDTSAQSFDLEHAITVSITITSSTTGSGFVTVDGGAITTPHVYTWTIGDSHTISANSPANLVSGQSQYLYTSWSDSGAQSHSYIVPSANATVTANFQLQYYLTVTGGNSPTPSAWYNSGATTTTTNTWIWGTSGGTRTALTNWQLDTVNQNPSRSNTGNLTTSTVTMSTYHTVNFVSVTQYYLTVTGGNTITYGTASPTSDNWYDVGSTTTVSSNWIWSVVAGQSRSAITNFAIDGSDQNPARQNTGTLTTIAISMTQARTVAFASVTQYYITVTGGTAITFGTGSPMNDQWYDSGSSTTVSSSGVWNRVGGSGTRVYSWKLDSGSNNNVTTAGTVTTSSVSMTTYHTVTFNMLTQYEVTLDSASGFALSSITSSTISGETDPWWYDSGTTVVVALNGVYGRSGGSGTRVASYALNGGSNNPESTTGTFDAFNGAISNHEYVTSVTNTQYQVTLDVTATSALNSITSPTIAGDNYWYDSSVVSLVLNGVWGRSGGTGNRLTGYVINGGSNNPTNTTSTVTVLTGIISGHKFITSTSVTQYQVTLDADATGALSSITSPTITSDNYWYDSATSVSLVLNGIYGRGGGGGTRITGYKINGGSNNPESTTGTFTVLNATSISGIEAITTTSTSQFQVTLDTGATNALSSITNPTITSDNYWYDYWTSVTLVLNGVYGRGATSGYRVSGYQINGGSNNPESTTGTFIVMNAVHITSVYAITTTTPHQYFLAVTGGNSITYGTASTISGDTGWYDSTISTTVTSNWVWSTVAGQSRTAITNYAIDGANQNPSRSNTSTLTTSSVSMSATHTVAFSSVTQYYNTLSTSVAGSTVGQTGSQTSDKWYDSGTDSTVTATSPYTSGGMTYTFHYWSWTLGGVPQASSANNPFVITMSSYTSESAQWDMSQSVYISSKGVSDDRLNINSYAQYWWTVRAGNGTIITTGTLTLNNSATATYIPSRTRWEYNITSSSVIIKTLYPSTISWDNGTLASQTSNYTSIIWDNIVVSSKGVTDSRTNINEYEQYYFTLRSQYDNSPIQSGAVTLNGSLSATWIGARSRWEYNTTKTWVQMQSLYVASISGNTYGINSLSSQTSNSTGIIWDAVMISLIINDNRMNVGDRIYANLNATYAYDGTAITDGVIKLNGTSMLHKSGSWWQLNMTQATIGQWTYDVDSITGNTYGITQFGIINLNKIGDRFTIPDSPDFAFNAFTVAVWANPSSNNSDGYLITQYDGVTGDGYFLYQTTDRGDGTPAWIFEVIVNHVGGFIYSDSPPTAGVWQHVVGMRDLSGDMKMYVNGILQANTTIVAGGVIDSTSPIYIGTLFTYSTADFNGLLCEHRFYNRELLQPEIYQLYQGRHTNDTGLIAVYRRVSYDYHDALWRDLSGNGHNGVIQGVTCTAGLSTDETVRPIWDKVSITLTITDSRINAGASANIYATSAKYMYDNASLVGGFFLNDTVTKSVVGIYGYTVASISDNFYNLTLFQSNSVSCIFDKLSITYSANSTTLTVGNTVNITAVIKRQYDNSTVSSYTLNTNRNGTYFENTNPFNDTKATAGRYLYTCKNVTDATYGITTFSSNTVTVIWSNVPSSAISVDVHFDYNANLNMTIYVSGVNETYSFTWVGYDKVILYSINGYSGNVTLNLYRGTFRTKQFLLYADNSTVSNIILEDQNGMLEFKTSIAGTIQMGLQDLGQPLYVTRNGLRYLQYHWFPITRSLNITASGVNTQYALWYTPSNGNSGYTSTTTPLGNGGTTTTSTSTTTSSTSTTNPPKNGSGIDPLLIIIVVIALIIALAGASLYMTRSRELKSVRRSYRSATGKDKKRKKEYYEGDY